MIKLNTIKVTNNFKRGRRRIIVHNDSNGDDTIISWNEGNNQKEFEVPEPGNFLLLTITPGPGNMGRSRIDLPDNSNFSFNFIPAGIENVTVASSNSTALRIPPGPPTWKLRIVNATDSPEQSQQISYTTKDLDSKDPTNVKIGDDPPE